MSQIPDACVCTATLINEQFIELENRHLTVRLDARQGAAAVAMLDKASGKPMAICQSYSNTPLPALREIVLGQKLREGRVDAPAPPYDLAAHGTDDAGAAYAVYHGHCVAESEQGTVDPLLRHLRVQKTVRLYRDESQVRVELRLINEADVAQDVAAWLSSGVRVTEEDVVVYAPTAQGVSPTNAYWHRGGSLYVTVPAATGGWTGAVADAGDRVAIYQAAPATSVESVWNWLGKFAGFTLGLGTVAQTLEPGQAMVRHYVLGVARGLPRLDGATMHLLGSIEAGPDKAGGQRHQVTVHLTAARPCRVKLDVALRGLDTQKRAKLLTTQTLQLGPDAVVPCTLEMDLPHDDTWVVQAVVRDLDDGDADELKIEQSVVVGLARTRFERRGPRLAGRKCWGPLVGERPLKPRTQRCNRKVRHPMIPWQTPTAGRRLKVLYIGEVSFNTAIYRDLARRGDFDWQFVNVWGTGDMLGGPYGLAEIRKARRLLRRFRPDCVVTAGLRYEAVPMNLIEDLWNHAGGGGGVVIIGREGADCQDIWPGRLAAEGSRREPVDLAAPLQRIFEAGIAPGPMGALESYQVGQGRVVTITKQLDWPELGPWGDIGPRNDMLPRYRGNTRLPDWEYHFAQYLQAIGHACGVQPSVRLADAALGERSLRVACHSSAERAITLEAELLSPDGLRLRRVRRLMRVAAGANALELALAPLPANDYLLHLWALDGVLPDANEALDDPEKLCREDHGLPVLDFLADFQHVPGEAAIADLLVEGERKQVPDAVTVAVAGSQDLLERAEIELEWRHGGATRVVWRRREALGGRHHVRFEGFDFAPTSQENLVAARLWVGEQCVAEKGRPLTACTPGNVADQEMAFLTAAGGEHDWYGTRMMRPWADHDGFDFTYLQYVMQGGGFPWKRTYHDQLDPPIVDEAHFRREVGPQLRREFEEKGNAYVCMTDEFLLGGEYDWSPGTLEVFRTHLRDRYGSIDALNAQWQSDFADFAQVMPERLADAREHADNPSPWIDFRLFMDTRVNRRYELGSEIARTISPLMKVGDSGAYAPGIGVGVDYYKMMKASGFTMTYQGLRSDWVRSFRRQGEDVVGVWMGYGWGKPFHVWDTLFRGYNILAWWGYLLHKRLTAHVNMTAIHMDLTPNPPFVQIGRQQAEVRRGLGRLLLHARPCQAAVRLAYSQPSVYVCDLLQERYENGSNAATSLLNQRGIAYQFVADDQVAAGELDAAPGGLLMLANSDAMDEPVASGYVRAVAAGASLLADMAAGMRDGHGRCQRVGVIDPTLGLDRSQATLLKPDRFQSVFWTEHAPPALRGGSGQMVPVLRGVKARPEHIWARFENGEPAVVAVHNAGAGLVVSVNTRLAWVSSNQVEQALNPEDRPDELSPNQTLSTLFDHVLGCADVRPPVSVESTTVKATLMRSLEDGPIRYHTMVLAPQAGQATVQLPVTSHTYDVRAGHYLGQVCQVSADVRASTLALIYAQLPYEIGSLKASATARASRPGQRVEIDGHLTTAAGAPAPGFHVVHVEVVDPQGQRDLALRCNVSVEQGRFVWSMPLPLNAATGSWKVELREVVSGRRRNVRFRVEAAGDSAAVHA